MTSIENIKLEINEISDKLKNISAELENLNTNNKLNFDNIKLQAKDYLINGHLRINCCDVGDERLGKVIL